MGREAAEPRGAEEAGVNVAVRSLLGVSVCSGVGGLDLGLDLALGGNLRTCLYVEREAFAAARLVQAMGAGHLAEAPVWSDIGTMCEGECAEYLRSVGPIDVLFGGIPCQPWSVAGKGLGKSDERDLWDATRAIVEAFAPSWVFLENVSGFAVRDGLGRVADELQGLGYRVAAGLFSAEEVGAPHGRLRLFVLAHRNGAESSADRSRGTSAGNDGRGDARRSGGDGVADTSDDQRGSGERGEEAGTRTNGSRRRRSTGVGPELAHAGPDAGGAEHGEQLQEPGAGAGEPSEPVGNGGRDSRGRGRRPECLGHSQSGGSGKPTEQERRADLERAGSDLGHAEGRGRREGRTEPAGRLGEPAPDQPERQVDDPDGPRRDGAGSGAGALHGGRERLSCEGRPLFPPGPSDREGWRRVLETFPELAPATESDLCLLADGASARIDLLRAAGNAVLPLTAALAFVSLYADLAGEDDGAALEADRWAVTA